MTAGPGMGAPAVAVPGRPAADAPPLRYYVTLTVASTALWTAMVGPLLVLLPEQAKTVAPDHKVGMYSLVAGVGGMLGIVAAPFAGRVSDRTRSRWGRRRPWIAGGALAGGVTLVLLGQADGIAGLLFGWAAFQIAGSLVLAGLTATIPDRVPENRRGRAAACLTVSWALAPVLGTALAAAADGRPEVAYGVLGLMLTIACAVFVVVVPDPPTDQAGATDSRRWRGRLWVSPRHHPDFAYAWLTRFCVALGQNMAVAFLYFFLQDAVHYAESHPGRTTADAMVVVTLTFAIAVITASVAGGLASDRLARRKIFVVIATMVFALGTSLGAAYPTWAGVLALAVLTGIGLGVYEAADMALVTQVLPAESERAKDLSLINMATTLGITLGPIAGAPVLEIGGYTTLYVTSGLVVLLGAVFVCPIRGVR